MKISVDTGKCREYANCVIESPDVFDLDEVSGKAVVLIEEPPAGSRDSVRKAVAACPVRAISLAE